MESDITTNLDDLGEYLKKIQFDPGNSLWTLFDKYFGVALYDVKQVTGWPDSFISKLSFELGELSTTDKKSNSDYDNWPFVDLPVQKKPFINIDGITYCFDYYNLFDNIYRVIQKIIKESDSSYATKWALFQQEASENLVANMFRKLLPGSEVYLGNYYPDENHTKQYDENDILIIYDTCVLIIEVKAGSFTYTPAATDFQAHIKSLDALIKKADYQCNRTLNYINRCERANFYKTNSKKSDLKFYLDKKKYNYFFTFCITVDNFNAVEAKIDKAHFLNINSGTLAVSVDDLDIYTEFFDSPLIFLHYLKHRQAASNNSILYLNDELDHLGLYIKHNDYNGYVSSYVTDKEQLVAFGYRRDLDAYFAGIHDDRLKIEKPKQIVPERIMQILIFLESKQIPRRVDFANFLLDMSDKARQDLNGFISYVVGREKLIKSMCPFALEGDFFMCCFVMIPKITIMPKRLIDLHTYALLKSRNKVEGWQVILSYDDDCCITDIAFKICHYFDFEKDKFQNFRNLNIYFLENLHAKCYMNENSALITSMNLYGYSEENNREMGLFINRSDNYDLYDDMKGECLSIINSAEKYTLDKKNDFFDFLDDLFPNSNNSEELEGHCIRCGTRIYLNENYPLCEDCYRVWAQYNNPNFQENYCHKCGQRITWQDGEPISYANPLCPKCSQEIHNWPM